MTRVVPWHAKHGSRVFHYESDCEVGGKIDTADWIAGDGGRAYCSDCREAARGRFVVRYTNRRLFEGEDVKLPAPLWIRSNG